MSDMEADRALEIGNLRKFGAWGAKFPQIANRPCSVCHGDMAPTDAKEENSPIDANPATPPVKGRGSE